MIFNEKLINRMLSLLLGLWEYGFLGSLCNIAIDNTVILGVKSLLLIYRKLCRMLESSC